MPRKGTSLKPPEAMTWRRALPVIVVAGILDALRLFFTMFWFFGPALAAVYCNSKAEEWVGALWGLTASACSAGAIAAGSALFEVTASFGTIMAMMVGFAGFLGLGMWMLASNARIFKVNATHSLWFVSSFGISEIPFLGAIPAFSIALWRMYRTQIHIEEKALRDWSAARTRELALERRAQQQQAAYFMQARTAELAQDDIY